MKNKPEKRHFDFMDIRVHGGGEEGDLPPMIAGHAAVFGKRSVEIFGFQEIIEPGAFQKTIKEDDVRAFWNHNSDHVLGRNTSGTLRLAEDKKGLAIEIDPPDTQAARDAMVSMERGDVSQMSFAFQTVSDRWETMAGIDIRTLEEVKLFEVSPVAMPAYPQTDVGVREICEESGLDLAALERVFFRSSNGLGLSEDDVEFLRRALDVLGVMQPAPPAISEDEHEDIRARIALASAG